MIKKFLDLGLQPLANNYLRKKDLVRKKKELFYHLEVGFNTKSKLISILNTVPSKKCLMIIIPIGLQCLKRCYYPLKNYQNI